MHSTVRLVLAVSLFAAGCTTSSNTPATTPTSIAPVTTAALGTAAPTTTATTLVTTTTVDRLTEIAAIFEDLEKRRLQAIFDQDEEAFRAVHANEAYEELSVQIMPLVRVVDPHAVTIDIREVLEDTGTCVAVRASIDLSSATERGEIGTDIHVLEKSDSGWGFSWTGEGWQCVGPHPLL